MKKIRLRMIQGGRFFTVTNSRHWVCQWVWFPNASTLYSSALYNCLKGKGIEC